MAKRRRRRTHHRRYRRNPSLHGHLRSAGAGMGGTFTNVIVGALGIIANDIVQGFIPATMLGAAQPLVKVGVPVLAAQFLGKRNPYIRMAATVAAAAAVAQAIRGFLPAGVPGLSGGLGLVSDYAELTYQAGPSGQIPQAAFTVPKIVN